uniref:Serine/threonine-protein kinase VRK1 n=1 Tax=Schistocephalus solidus TaxID=70667 RepID=A0A0V0J5M1_SCHSO
MAHSNFVLETPTRVFPLLAVVTLKYWLSILCTGFIGPDPQLHRDHQVVCHGTTSSQFHYFVEKLADPSVRLNVNEATRNQVVRRKEDSMRDYNTFSKSTGLGSLPALESFLRQVGALGYSDRPNYTLLESTLRELAKSLSLKEKQAVNHTLSARSRAVTKTQLQQSADSSTDSQAVVNDVIKKSYLLSDHTVDTYCGSSFDNHSEFGARPSPRRLLRDHEGTRRSPRLQAICPPDAAHINANLHAKVATKTPLRSVTCSISDPQTCQSSHAHISPASTLDSTDSAHRRRHRRPKQYVGPRPDGGASPLVASQLSVSKSSEARRARTVAKTSVSSQTSPHLLARANERRRLRALQNIRAV